MVNLDRRPDKRLLIHQGTVTIQILALLKEAAASGKAVVQDTSVTVSWNSMGKAGPPNRTVVFYKGAVVEPFPSLDPDAMAFQIYQPEGTRPKYDTAGIVDLIVVRAANGEAWVSPHQYFPRPIS